MNGSKSTENLEYRIYCNICLNEYPCNCRILSKGVEFSEYDPCQFKRNTKIDKIFKNE